MIRTATSKLAVLGQIKIKIALIQTIVREEPSDASLAAIKTVADLAYSDIFMLINECENDAEEEQQAAVKAKEPLL
jgi:hypothetical protein